MTIQIPNPGTGNGATGDNEFVLWSKVKDNFSDQTNAASRLLGTGAGQIPLAENIIKAVALAVPIDMLAGEALDTLDFGDLRIAGASTVNTPSVIMNVEYAQVNTIRSGISAENKTQYAWGYFTPALAMRQKIIGRTWTGWVNFLSTANTTKDSNGFLKGASPIVDLYSEHIDLNADATEQGSITFEKLDVGDYLVKGSLGFAQEGWYIETPKDANGNVLVAVVYEQLANNDISIKTYAKKFDDETGDIVANLAKPRDIPTGRFISLRLHELPKEPPVMPMDEPKTEV